MENKTCKTCKETKVSTDFYFNRTAKDGGSVCKDCKRKRDAKFRERNRELTRKWANKYRNDNKIKLNENSRVKYGTNRERILANQKAYQHKRKQLAIDAYGGKCVCCGEKNFEFLTIDHIKGGGRNHRKSIKNNNIYLHLKKTGYPKDGYRLLCSNCNFSMGMYGYCPHNKSSI